MRAVLLLLLLAAPGLADDLAGRWRVHVTRGDWAPHEVHGDLTLTRDGAAWRGALRLEVVFGGEPLEVSTAEVATDQVTVRATFRTTELVFEGKLEGGGRLRGRSTWATKGEASSTYPWEAVRADAPAPRFDHEELPRLESVEAAGVSSSALSALIRAAEEAKTGSLVVLKDGRVLVERHFQRERRAANIQSITKAVVTLAVLRLLEEGKLPSLDEPATTWFPEWKQNARKSRITLRHLMTHTSGIATNTDALQQTGADMVAVARAQRAEFEPGSRWSYSNAGFQLVGAIATLAGGRPIEEQLDDLLFAPLGIRRVWWMHDGHGNTCTFGGLQLEATDLARVGQLVLQEGRWGERQLLRRESVALLWTPAPVERDEPMGTGWFRVRDPEASVFTFPRQGLRALGDAGGPAEALTPLLDTGILGEEALRAALHATLSEAQLQRYGAACEAATRLPYDVDGPIIGIGHSGSLGQFLYLFPRWNLVGVRTYLGDDDDWTGFGEFPRLLLKLVQP